MRITEIFGLKKQKRDLHLRTESDEDRIQMVIKQTDDLTWFHGIPNESAINVKPSCNEINGLQFISSGLAICLYCKFYCLR